MRSALLCVLFTLLVRGSRADDDFKPMPIPLNEWQPWHDSRRDARAGTLHETIRTETPAVAAVPAHYWEDALRHSVYLTLVRDKIDQLIAKGDVISPDTKPENFASKDIDEHDLWEKIKTAPFDRIQEDEPSSYGDVTIMAKGRLMEERGGFRFTEDERSKEKCNDDKCMDGVKAFWSVKRVRQREVETSPGKYHYELTFSVISQHPKKQKSPYENGVRTFTVKETSPEQVLDMPQEHRTLERAPIIPQNPTYRPARQIWVHKNIVPTSHSGRQYQHGLERIFSSLFSDDDDEYAPPRYRPAPPMMPQYPQYAKVGYVGSPSDQQKRLTPYPYKPHSYKYSRPLPPPPFTHMQHHYIESDTIGHPYATPPDYRFGPPTKPMKTTRPAVLPTPLPPITPAKNWTEEVASTSSLNTTVSDVPIYTTEYPTRAPELITIHKTYSKPRPTPMKINYFAEHVRPPVYNAPPGVFVTMDKKPFKPLPPLKFMTKPMKYNKPVDFRPSPQVLDMQQFSEPDPQRDTAFRPITWNYASANTTEKVEIAESTTQVNQTRKTTHKGKKPPKKHENIKATRVTTATPEIITASSDTSEESDDAMQWANVVGAFSKTTPMASQKVKSEAAETTTSPTTTSSTTPSTTTTVKRRTTTTTEAIEESTSTTAKPKPKRTRPPPKFNKPDKLKKHKRITTTTKAPDAQSTQDLTPQASSAAATKPSWASVNKTQTTTTTTTTTSTTTPRPTTTTTKATTTTTIPTTVKDDKSPPTTQPKIKNRFRQSTLLTKGTSVNHDKWSAHADKSKPTAPASVSKNPPRRKGSNFHGYVSSTTPRVIEDNEKYHEDQGPPKLLSVKPLTTTTPVYEETADQYESNSEPSDYNQEDDIEDDQETDEQETRDHTEYILGSTTPSERTNEVHHDPITTEEIITSPASTPKNKTKCKKKKPQNITEYVGDMATEQISSSSSTSTTEAATPSIFEELFGSFTVDDNETTQKDSHSTDKPDLEEQGSEKHGHFVKLDDDLQDFLDSLERGGKSDADDQYEDDDDEEPAIDDDDSLEDHDDEAASPRDAPDSYDDDSYHDRDRPYSLLELMAME